MRALLVVRADAATKPGGDVVHAELAARSLRALRVDATVVSSDAPDARGYDVAHVFGIFEPARAAAQIAAIRAGRTPLVLSPIWLDQRTFLTCAPEIERALAARSRRRARPAARRPHVGTPRRGDLGRLPSGARDARLEPGTESKETIGPAGRIPIASGVAVPDSERARTVYMSQHEAAAVLDRAGGWAAWPAYVSIAAVTAALALPLPLEPDSALDGSWRYLLAIAQERHLVFGRDLIFTYGPLGWISGRLDVPQHALALRIALGAIAAAAGIATALLASRARSPVRAALAFALVASAFAASRAPADLALEPAYETVFIAVVLLAAATPRARWAPLAYAGAGICAGLALGMKIVAFADIACAAVVALLPYAFVDRRGALSAAAAFGVGFVLTAALALRDTIAAGAFGSYLALSAEITRGYAFAMAAAGTPGEERATLAAVIAALVVAALCVREGRPRTAAIVGVIAVLAWKHSTIREDIEHTAPLYATVAMLCGCAVATSRGRLVFGAASAVGVLSLVHLSTLYAVHHRGVGPPLAAARVPASLLPARGSIDALPIDVVTAAEAALRYAPLPMFQLAFAYTPPIDALDDAALRAHGADTILFRFAPVDGRYVPSEAPATFRGLLCRYAFEGAVTAVDGRRFSRLVRQPYDTCHALRTFDAVAKGGTIRLPPLGRGEFAVARIAFDLTARGRLASVVGRVGLPQVALISGEGRTLRRDIVPETADDGIVVAPAPADAAELESLFRGVSGPAVTALRVEPGSAYRVRRIALIVFRRENSDREGGRARAQSGLQRIVVTPPVVDSLFFTPGLLGEVAGA